MRYFFKKRIFGILVIELMAFIGFYVFFALFYDVTLLFNRAGISSFNASIFSISRFFNSVGLDYILKFLMTIPVWFLIFRVLKKWSHSKKIILHLLLIPFLVVFWQQLYYLICESIGFFHLFGAARAWDIYIPALFFVLQFGILHAYHYHIENKNKIELENTLRNAALKSELSAIKAQLNPHFLYNIFNTISASVPSENEKTRDMIAQLSDLFRYQLKASQVDLVPLKEELDFIKKYLNLEKARFQERLQINIQVDDAILNEPIPPMLLQPLIENSIKHGLASLIEGGHISIIIRKKNEKLAFEISDSGIGIKDKTHVFGKGIGLTNTRLRLEKMYHTTLNLSDNMPQGLKINFEL